MKMSSWFLQLAHHYCLLSTLHPPSLAKETSHTECVQFDARLECEDAGEEVVEGTKKVLEADGPKIEIDECNFSSATLMLTFDSIQ